MPLVQAKKSRNAAFFMAVNCRLVQLHGAAIAVRQHTALAI